MLELWGKERSVKRFDANGYPSTNVFSVTSLNLLPLRTVSRDNYVLLDRDSNRPFLTTQSEVSKRQRFLPCP